nr:uncharacterized protein LOC129425920 [Misgurnus anguillicaudatus]
MNRPTEPSRHMDLAGAFACFRGSRLAICRTSSSRETAMSVSAPNRQMAAATRAPHPVPFFPILEGRAMGVVALSDTRPSSPTPESSTPPVSLRGKRERRVTWDSPSEGSLSEFATPINVLTSPAMASAPRPRRKKKRRGLMSQPGPSSLTEQPAQLQPSALPLQPLPQPAQRLSSRLLSPLQRLLSCLRCQMQRPLSCSMPRYIRVNTLLV